MREWWLVGDVSVTDPVNRRRIGRNRNAGVQPARPMFPRPDGLIFRTLISTMRSVAVSVPVVSRSMTASGRDNSR